MSKERPILFSALMVKALLEGRKTQTRRIVKPRKDVNFGCLLYPNELAGEVNNGVMDNCPWRPGDRLWVRETFAIVPRTAYRCSEGVQQTLRPDDDHDAAIYRAGWERSTGGFRWRPSIFMPRWASRITLEIVSVRVERLQDISETDAWAEGCEGYDDDVTGGESGYSEYARLWESINGRGSWDKNPWVWVIEFKNVSK